jgi:hypothetical protein
MAARRALGWRRLLCQVSKFGHNKHRQCTMRGRRPAGQPTTQSAARSRSLEPKSERGARYGAETQSSSTSSAQQEGQLAASSKQQGGVAQVHARSCTAVARAQHRHARTKASASAMHKVTRTRNHMRTRDISGRSALSLRPGRKRLHAFEGCSRRSARLTVWSEQKQKAYIHCRILSHLHTGGRWSPPPRPPTTRASSASAVPISTHRAVPEPSATPSRPQYCNRTPVAAGRGARGLRARGDEGGGARGAAPSCRRSSAFHQK